MASVGDFVSFTCPTFECKKWSRSQGKHTRSDQTATPVEALAGKDTLERVLLLAVGSEHVANLAGAGADVTSGHVGVGTNVPLQLAHEGDAEAADLVVGLALGVEVRTTLATTHHHCKYHD